MKKKLKKKTIIFGNLPYNISSQILIKMIKFKQWPPKYSSLIFMFQKELAERIYGKYGSSSYGRLSIISNYRLKIVEKFFVSKNCFVPRPKVESAVIHFKKTNNEYYRIKKLENLEKITGILFSNKRKMINKNLKKILKKNFDNIVKIIDLKSRPSELKPENYYQITELYEKY